MTVPNIPAAKRAGLPVDLDRLTRDGDEWLSPEERYALKTHGVCAQVQPGVFMIRVRVPGGRLIPAQTNGLATLAATYGGNWIHLSTRQNIELHHVAARDVTEVLKATEALGLTNRSACGHTLRNVMVCPDAGYGLDEPFDCFPDGFAVSDAIVARSAELNTRLPSRINMTFGGCPACREHARLNDVGFESIVVDGRPAYRLWAGGSLGTAPALSVLLHDCIERQDVLAAANALVELFVTRGAFETPKKARMKYLLEQMGEGAFKAEWLALFTKLKRRSSYRPEPVTVLKPADISEILSHVPDRGWSTSVRPQHQPGLAMVTVNVPLGDLTGDEFRFLGTLAAFGDGLVHATRNQNLLYRNVPVRRVAELRDAITDRGLALADADAALDVRACTGSDVCSLAITAAPNTGHALTASHGLARNNALRVHVSGCPNSCAQHQAGDIGLAGAKVRINGETRLGYTVFLGADIPNGKTAALAGRVADDDVPALVDGVVGAWESLRQPGERMADTVDRLGVDAFAAHVASVARGFAPGDESAEDDAAATLVD